jgi:replication factor C subunit 3/5
MFFIDKYKPHNINETVYHNDILKQLQFISQDDCIPNIIFYGPPTSGKKTIVNIFLEMIYDKSIHKVNNTKYTITGSSGSKSEILIKQSNYHIIIEPNNKHSDKYIVQDIIKEYAKRIPMNFFTTNRNFKLVLINNMHNLSYHAQTSLRRTMEIYAKTCRFIMITNSLSKVIEPLRSRCNSIRVSLPTRNEIFKFLVKVALNESITLKLSDYTKIRNKCGRNVKKCLWELESIKYGINKELDLITRTNDLCDLILEKKLVNLRRIREMIYSIIITNFSGSDIIILILDRLLIKIKSNKDRYNIIQTASICENRLVHSRHEMHHLEKFIIDIMYILIKK